MAAFEWRGVNAAGRTVKGVRDAETRKALQIVLRREGVMVTEVLDESAAKKRKAREVDLKRFFRRTTLLDVAMMTRQLATLLGAGIPLVDALSALIDQLDDPDLKGALTQTRDRVNEGTSFGDALQAHPKIFSTLFVNMVAAGESSGTLEVVLTRLAEFLESQGKMRNKIIAAIAYPGFMAAIGVLVIGIMMTVVVPKVTAIYDSFNQSLPWYTNILIFVSDLLAGFWWLFLIVIVGSIEGFRRWRRTAEGRAKWDRFVLRVPIFGRLATMVAVSRFSRTLSTLLGSGVQILRAMEITGRVLGNTELTRIVDEARTSVREGESIAVPLKKSGRFPPIMIHMIAIGERSGQLEQMLEHVANAYDNQVDARLSALTALLEPVMIVFMGGFAGSIAFAILMPLLQMNEFF